MNAIEYKIVSINYGCRELCSSDPSAKVSEFREDWRRELELVKAGSPKFWVSFDGEGVFLCLHRADQGGRAGDGLIAILYVPADLPGDELVALYKEAASLLERTKRESQNEWDNLLKKYEDKRLKQKEFSYGKSSGKNNAYYVLSVNNAEEVLKKLDQEEYYSYENVFFLKEDLMSEPDGWVDLSKKLENLYDVVYLYFDQHENGYKPYLNDELLKNGHKEYYTGNKSLDIKWKKNCYKSIDRKVSLKICKETGDKISLDLKQNEEMLVIERRYFNGTWTKILVDGKNLSWDQPVSVFSGQPVTIKFEDGKHNYEDCPVGFRQLAEGVEKGKIELSPSEKKEDCTHEESWCNALLKDLRTSSITISQGKIRVEECSLGKDEQRRILKDFFSSRGYECDNSIYRNTSTITESYYSDPSQCKKGKSRKNRGGDSYGRSGQRNLRSKKKKLLIVCLFVIIVAFLVVGAYFLFWRNNGDGNQTEAVQETVENSANKSGFEAGLYDLCSKAEWEEVLGCLEKNRGRVASSSLETQLRELDSLCRCIVDRGLIVDGSCWQGKYSEGKFKGALSSFKDKVAKSEEDLDDAKELLAKNKWKRDDFEQNAYLKNLWDAVNEYNYDFLQEFKEKSYVPEILKSKIGGLKRENMEKLKKNSGGKRNKPGDMLITMNSYWQDVLAGKPAGRTEKGNENTESKAPTSPDDPDNRPH